MKLRFVLCPKCGEEVKADDEYLECESCECCFEIDENLKIKTIECLNCNSEIAIHGPGKYNCNNCNNEYTLDENYKLVSKKTSCPRCEKLSLQPPYGQIIYSNSEIIVYKNTYTECDLCRVDLYTDKDYHVFVKKTCPKCNKNILCNTPGFHKCQTCGFTILVNENLDREGEMIDCTNPACDEKIYAIYPEDYICQKCGTNVHYDGKEIPEYEILTPPKTDGE